MRADLWRRAGQGLQVREGSSILKTPEFAIAHASLRSFTPVKKNEIYETNFLESSRIQPVQNRYCTPCKLTENTIFGVTHQKSINYVFFQIRRKTYNI